MSEVELRLEKLIRRTMNLKTDFDLSTARYGLPANWDSIRHVELFIYIQREFKISFSADEIGRLETYQLLRESFLKKLGF